jgi:integrase
MKTQRGQIFRSGKNWYGRWRRDELVAVSDLSKTERRELEARGVLNAEHDGSKVVVRRQHCEKLATFGDTYRRKSDCQSILDAKLLSANEGRESPESTLTVADYAENYFLPYAKSELKQSTAHGYAGIFKTYLKPRLASIALRDFRTVDMTNLLAEILECHGLGRKSLRHCKSLMGTIFSHAKNAGVLDGANPIRDSRIPRAAKASAPTHAYTPAETIAMLDVLTGTAKRAIALMFFTGLRPGEARAAKWTDLDREVKVLRVHSSMWRTTTTSTKTLASEGVVPICSALREILEESKRESEYILTSPAGKPADLRNLAYRVIVPRLLRCAECDKEKKGHDEQADHAFQQLPAWRGWYALRRGCATLVTTLDSAIAAKGMLRHTDLSTTSKHYIKDVPAETLRAAERMDALFQRSTSAPN